MTDDDLLAITGADLEREARIHALLRALLMQLRSDVGLDDVMVTVADLVPEVQALSADMWRLMSQRGRG